MLLYLNGIRVSTRRQVGESPAVAARVRRRFKIMIVRYHSLEVIILYWCLNKRYL